LSVLRLTIIGAAGRMGQALARAAGERSDLRIAAAVDAPGGAYIGRDLGELAGAGRLGVSVTSDLSAALAQSDAALEFSHPSATATSLAACVAAGKPLLIGTTGHGAHLHHELERAARHIALLVAANTSIGVTLLIEVARRCAEALPLQFDVEIFEAHHRHKTDAPSGTALTLGQAVAEARGRALEEVGVRNRIGAGPRQEGEIGFAVMRGGDIVGEHSVVFAGNGEQLVLTHRATDRAVFARGALEAVVWLVRRSPGRYYMKDILSKTAG
jgi:4-hydroxy-tetrahydrodipicolinate reductase